MSAKPSRLALLTLLPVLAACATNGDPGGDPARRAGQLALEHHATVLGAIGARDLLDRVGLWTSEYIHAGLVAYAIYDPFAPTWQIRAGAAGEDRVVLDLTMKRLITGGEGEARQVFLRTARRMADEGGYAGFDVLRYEEGMESTRPFARRIASGEIRLVGSRQFPALSDVQALQPADGTRRSE